MEEFPAARVSTGLDWLDRILEGGLPAQSLVVLAGVPGSGKSILAFHLLAQAALESGNAMLVTTTHQPLSKMRSQYSGLSFLGPTGVFDALDVLELDTDIEGDTLLRLLNSIVSRIQDHKVGVAAIDSFRAISGFSQPGPTVAIPRYPQRPTGREQLPGALGRRVFPSPRPRPARACLGRCGDLPGSGAVGGVRPADPAHIQDEGQ